MPAHYEQLLELAMCRATDGKGDLAASIAETCLAPNAGLSQSELSLTFDIVRIIVESVEVKIRRHLSEYLAERDDVPPDLVTFLANDEISVAYPVLVHNRMLHDDELINIVANQTKKHRLAVSIRPHVSEAVSDALLQTGDPDIIETLLYNKGAEIRQETFDSVVNTARVVESLHLPLLHRRDLSADQAWRLYTWVGDTLRAYILANFDIDPKTIESATDVAIDDAMQGENDDANDAPNTKDALRAALRRNDRHEIEIQFTACVELDAVPATKILYGRNIQALAIACKASGMSVALFDMILTQTRRRKSGTDQKQANESARALAFYERIDPSSACKLLKKWRISPSSISQNGK